MRIDPLSIQIFQAFLQSSQGSKRPRLSLLCVIPGVTHNLKQLNINGVTNVMIDCANLHCFLFKKNDCRCVQRQSKRIDMIRKYTHRICYWTDQTQVLVVPCITNKTCIFVWYVIQCEVAWSQGLVHFWGIYRAMDHVFRLLEVKQI